MEHTAMINRKEFSEIKLFTNQNGTGSSNSALLIYKTNVCTSNIHNNTISLRFQASVAMLMRSALFWDITQDFLILKAGTNTLSWNVGKGLPFDTL
jgi:hypothetical protein